MYKQEDVQIKYSELISFQPIESTIQLIEAGEKETAKKLVQTYVMSDNMAENMKAPVFEQLQMDEVVDNKGVLIVGNYGSGKSHLMSVISSVATDADNIQYLQNQNFAKEMECIAGKFEVLRIEIGGVTMPLREILFGFIQEDFQKRGVPFEMPDWSNVKDNKKVVRDVMMNFEGKYPDKGYLIVVDEFLSYLTSRDERQIVLDLEFFRALGEMCSKSKLRVVFGVQEKIFDNPKFSFVSERILKKTAEQKALIRGHLEKFSGLYTGMSSRMEKFVDLYPIHPSYIDVFNKISVIETRHILKDISTTIRSIFDEEVPENAPGIYSFDSCWVAILNNGMFKSDPMISRVVNASTQLEEIIDRSFPKPPYKPLAKKIIYALSVHRLTTGSLDVQFGLTAENLKDDLCLYLPLPEQEAEFLLGLVSTTLKDIMTTVSGQFIIHNDANNQYYIDVDKVVDYDEKIKLILAIREYVDFKTRCVDTVNYVANIERIERGAEFKSQIENAKAAFREIRDKIMDGEPGEASARKVEDALAKVKEKYIDMYMAEHEKKRLGVKDAKRRGQLQEGAALGNLKKLRTIDILSTAKLGEIETDLAGLKICYDLKKEDLKQHHLCKCGFSLDDYSKNVFGQLDNIENRIDSTLKEWAKTLLDTISDPLVAGSKEYLSADQKKVVEDFISRKAFPEKVDDFFVKAISQLLQGFEPVVIDADEMVKELEALPPMDEEGFVKKLKEMLSGYIKGKDAVKLRIVVKRKEIK